MYLSEEGTEARDRYPSANLDSDSNMQGEKPELRVDFGSNEPSPVLSTTTAW